MLSPLDWYLYMLILCNKPVAIVIGCLILLWLLPIPKSRKK